MISAMRAGHTSKDPKEGEMSLPEIATREEWLDARKALLAKEKEMTYARDALNVERRNLPMVEVEKNYEFEGPDGKLSLLDMFEGRRQLIVRHFMFDPSWEDGCPSCTAGVDEFSDGLLEHLHMRDTTLVIVARAPLAKIEAYKAKRSWKWPFYSSYGSDFNYDFDVTMDPSVKPPSYNYRTEDDWREKGETVHLEGEQPGQSCFLRDTPGGTGGDRVFHTYSSYGRGAEMTGGSYYFLDLTALGRQEDWEEPKGRADSARGAIPSFAE
jgi:predicted dithiol-disulfide oxidoreductase (DUF899 family)